MAITIVLTKERPAFRKGETLTIKVASSSYGGKESRKNVLHNTKINCVYMYAQFRTVKYMSKL